MIPQKRASFSKVIALYISVFSIFHAQVIAKIETFWSLFRGVEVCKVFGIWNFYTNQLIFRVKQPYTLSFIEIPVGVVTHLGDFTENPPSAFGPQSAAFLY